MLLHLVLVAVGAVGMATPKAVLAELVTVALLASVPESHHALAVAVGALHGMEDWRPERRGERGTKPHQQNTRTNPEENQKSNGITEVETGRTKSLNLSDPRCYGCKK